MRTCNKSAKEKSQLTEVTIVTVGICSEGGVEETTTGLD